MTLTLWKDNRLPLLTDTLTSSGTAVNLTGCTVTFSMRRSDSAALKVSAASATITDATAGTVSYAWAAVDVDTVGDYDGWWTVSTGGKSQDTPEFEVSIVEHAPDAVVLSNPVGTDGATEIYKGDSYLNAYERALVYQVSVMDAPDLTGSTFTYRISGALATTMTLVGEDTLRVDLTSAQTSALSVGSHQFEIEAGVASGEYVTLLRSDIVVLADMSGP